MGRMRRLGVSQCAPPQPTAVSAYGEEVAAGLPAGPARRLAATHAVHEHQAGAVAAEQRPVDPPDALLVGGAAPHRRVLQPRRWIRLPAVLPCEADIMLQHARTCVAPQLRLLLTASELSANKAVTSMTTGQHLRSYTAITSQKCLQTSSRHEQQTPGAQTLTCGGCLPQLSERHDQPALAGGHVRHPQAIAERESLHGRRVPRGFADRVAPARRANLRRPAIIGQDAG